MHSMTFIWRGIQITKCGRIKKRRGRFTLKISPHSLRVRCARSLMLSGLPRDAIDGWLRWKSNAGDVYLNLAPADLDYICRPSADKKISERALRSRVLHRAFAPTYAQ